MVGGGGEQHVGDAGGRHARRDGGEQDALGPVGVAHLDETAKPGFEAGGGHVPGGQWIEREARRLALAIVGHVHHAVVERQHAILRRQVVQDVGQRGQDRQAGTPPGGTIARAEAAADVQDLARRYAGLEQGQHGLDHDEREVLLQAIFQAALPARPPILAPGVEVDPDRAVAHLDRVDAHVVGEGVEGAAAAQVEARVVPVAGQDAVAAAATAQREAHVRAAVIDGVDGLLVVEERDPVAAAGHDDHALLAHVVERGDTNEVTALGGCSGSHGISSPASS